ncbi:MAG: formate dehydrogenase accessory sulfurtransferase FdhD [Anaerolineaceae bacterium]
MNDGHIPLSYRQFTTESIETVHSNIAVEASVSLTVNGLVWLTFQCTPEELEALAVGFLFNEGFIREMVEIENLHVCDQKDNVDVWLNHSVQKPVSWRRTSGCHGGTSSADLQRDHFEPITSQALLSPEQIFNLMGQFLNEQKPHSESGGVHTTALADGTAQLFQIHDIGRHNTIDKIAGRILLDKIKIETPILITSGRISSDMLQKAVRLRTPFLISMRSTSQMGVSLADQWGVTLIGGARRGRFNLFSHPERIKIA